MTRREFARTTIASAAAAGLATACPKSKNDAATGGIGAPVTAATGAAGPAPCLLEINGVKKTFLLEPRVTLLDALRDTAELTGTKAVCDRGACGACTVLWGGEPICSCLMLAHEAQAKPVTTIEGLGGPAERLDPLQEAFVAFDALQCGFCTPGMVMSCKALLDRKKAPSAQDVKDAISGNLCRCGTYPRVVEAVLAASKKRG